MRWSKRRSAVRRQKENAHPASRRETQRLRPPRCCLETRLAEAPGEAGGTVENTEDAEPEVGTSVGLDRGDDVESGGQAEHDIPDAGDATEHSFLAETNDAEGGGEEDDSQASPDGAHSGSLGEHAETPTPADGPDDAPPEGAAQPSGLSVQEPTEEPAYEDLRRQVRMCQTPEVCYPSLTLRVLSS
eukprot:33579-Pleurochrysis_carterae.AAC.1